MVSAGVRSLGVRGVPWVRSCFQWVRVPWVRSRSLMVSAFSGSPCPVVPAGLGPRFLGAGPVSSFPRFLGSGFLFPGLVWVVQVLTLTIHGPRRRDQTEAGRT